MNQKVKDILLIVAVVLCVGGFFGLMIYSSYHYEHFYWNAPCSDFENYPVKDVPARCLKEFK